MLTQRSKGAENPKMLIFVASNIGMTIENRLAKETVDASIKIHSELGPGLLESVYERVLQKELESRGLVVARQVRVPITYDGLVFDEGFRADLIIENALILELKSVEILTKLHSKQQ